MLSQTDFYRDSLSMGGVLRLPCQWKIVQGCPEDNYLVVVHNLFVLIVISDFRYSVGDADASFTIQSGGKCFNYAVVLEECGIEEVSHHHGCLAWIHSHSHYCRYINTLVWSRVEDASTRWF